jgi:hypothetical protein
VRGQLHIVHCLVAPAEQSQQHEQILRFENRLPIADLGHFLFQETRKQAATRREPTSPASKGPTQNGLTQAPTSALGLIKTFF